MLLTMVCKPGVRNCPENFLGAEMCGFGVRKCPQISPKNSISKNTYEKILRGNFLMSDDSGRLR